MNHIILVVNVVVYLFMLCVGIYFIHMGEVMERFWLQRTDFTEHKEGVTELPTVLAYVSSRSPLGANIWDPQNNKYGEKFNISYGRECGRSRSESDGVNLTFGQNKVFGGLNVLFEQLYGANFFKITPENFVPKMPLDYCLTYIFEDSIASKIIRVGLSLRPENSSVHVNGRRDMNGYERNFQIKVGEYGNYVFKQESTIHLKTKESCRDMPYNELVLHELSKELQDCAKPCKNGQIWADIYGKQLDRIMEHLPFCNSSQEKECYLDKLTSAERRVIVKPCTTFEYNGELDVYPSGEKNLAWFNLHFLSPPKISVKEEYLIYDAVSMVSAIGGTLGLCVGFSFTGLISCLLRYLELGIKRIKPMSKQSNTQVFVRQKNSVHSMMDQIKRIEARLHELEILNQ